MNKYKKKYNKYKKKYLLLKRIFETNTNINTQLNYENRIILYNEIKDMINNINDCSDDKLQLISKGGHGFVYKGVLSHKNQLIEVALKVLKADSFVFNNRFKYNIKIWKEYIILKKCTELL